jgi:hypothetical protein
MRPNPVAILLAFACTGQAGRSESRKMNATFGSVLVRHCLRGAAPNELVKAPLV